MLATMFEAGVDFLADLAEHNEKSWFEANRDRYERELREPAIALVETLAPELAAMSPHFRAVGRGVGSSVGRLNRDTRFSADKSPYKDWLGIHITHDSGKEAPGLYVRIAPGRCGVGVGVWTLEPAELARVRRGIADGRRWAPVRAALDAGGFSWVGESLKKVPREFAPDHPFAEDLKRKNLGAGRGLDPSSPHFAEDVLEGWRAGWPLMVFLCESLGLPL